MKNIIKLSLVLGIVIATIGCAEELVKSDYDYNPDPDNAPKNVISGDVSNESAVSAVVSGSVATDVNLLDWGVVYYKASAPEDFLVKSAKDSSNSYSFSISLSGLVPGSDYKFKTFALNKDGITYGNEISFSTQSAQSLPFSLSLEDPITAWLETEFTFIDADDDGLGWDIYEETGLVSFSWDDVPLMPENYVILPPIQLGSENSTISLGLEPGDPSYYEEKYKIVISTSPIITPSEASAAENIFEEVLSSPDPYTQTIDIPEEYKDKVVWIGISHFDVTDMYSIIISSIKVE